MLSALAVVLLNACGTTEPVPTREITYSRYALSRTATEVPDGSIVTVYLLNVRASEQMRVVVRGSCAFESDEVVVEVARELGRTTLERVALESAPLMRTPDLSLTPTCVFEATDADGDPIPIRGT